MAARQRHQGEGSRPGVELRGDVAVRARVGQDRGDGALRVGPVAYADAAGGPQRRARPVGSHHEPGLDGVPVRQRDARRRLAGHGAGGVRLDQGEVVLRPGAGAQALHQAGALDVPAEGVEADLGGAELRRRRPEQAAGVVDDLQRAERARVRRHRLPGAERLQEAHRPVEERDGPPVRDWGVAPDQRRGDPVARDRQRGGEPGCPGSDHRDRERRAGFFDPGSLGHAAPHDLRSFPCRPDHARPTTLAGGPGQGRRVASARHVPVSELSGMSAKPAPRRPQRRIPEARRRARYDRLIAAGLFPARGRICDAGYDIAVDLFRAGGRLSAGTPPTPREPRPAAPPGGCGRNPAPGPRRRSPSRATSPARRRSGRPRPSRPRAPAAAR